MTPGTFNFKPQYRTNTFNGTQITFENLVSGVNVPIDLTGALLTMQLKKTASSTADKIFTIGNGLTVTNPIDGIVTIDPFLVGLSPYKYLYDFKVQFPDGTITTYLTGTFEVKQNLV